MSLVKKLKDMLFEEEEEFTEPIKIRDEVKETEPKIVKIEPPKEEIKEEVKESFTPNSERELFKSESSFTFPDFDEEEFKSNIGAEFEQAKNRSNVLEYERKKVSEKRSDYGRFERIETKEYTEKRKFKPSPIISPVYGILNQDYKAEDIIKKGEDTNIDIETVRRKAFEPKKEEIFETPIRKSEVSEISQTKDEFGEPVVTFFEEKDTIKVKGDESNNNYKSIDDLLESAADEINLEDTLELPKTNNLDAIEEELEKLDVPTNENGKDLDEELDTDLFELIDSMYETREESKE